MDAAFGVDNLNPNMIGLIIITINDNADVNTAVEAIDKIITGGIEDVPGLMDIYNSLLKSKKIQVYLNNFRDNIQRIQSHPFHPKIADLRFENDDNFHATVNYDPDFDNTMAYTGYNELTLSNLNIDISIVFNTDETSEFSIYDFPKVVATNAFIHEIFHAVMFRYLWAKRFDFSGLYDEGDLFSMLKENRKDLIFNTFTSSFLDVHHNVMALKYRTAIIEILQDVYPSMTYDQANALAWIGLEGTVPYNDQMQNEPDFINYITQNTQNVLQIYNEYIYQ